MPNCLPSKEFPLEHLIIIYRPSRLFPQKGNTASFPYKAKGNSQVWVLLILTVGGGWAEANRAPGMRGPLTRPKHRGFSLLIP